MKKLINSIILLFYTICVAQSPILPLYDSSITVQGAYYKDLQNDFERFVGEWKYEQGNDILIIKIVKKEAMLNNYSSFNFYVDVLVAEYRYVENGIEKINTLQNLNLNHTDYYDYNITANIIVKPVSTNPDVCPNCGPNDVMVKGPFRDPERDILFLDPWVIFRHKIENGVEKIFFTLYANGNYFENENEGAEQNQYDSYNIPFGRYELIKQP